jgi:hypothetical protein
MYRGFPHSAFSVFRRERPLRAEQESWVFNMFLMSSRRSIPHVVSFLILFGIAGCWLACRFNPSAHTWVAPRATSHLLEHLPAKEALTPMLDGADDPGKTARAAATPVRMAAQDAARLNEEIELRTLAQTSGLELSETQWRTFAEVTLFHQAIRHAYEAEIASVSVTSTGMKRLEIPVYGAAGDALRELFLSSLRRELGAGVAAEIENKIGARIEARFAGFGVALQTLDFQPDATADNAGTTVTRTVAFWNSAAGEEHLSTRKETFFPELEDPSGDQWGPLLARVDLAPRTASGG